MKTYLKAGMLIAATLLIITVQSFAQTPKYVGYRGGFDIGSQGVKLSVIGFYFQNNKLRYKLVYDRQETVGLIKGMETNGGKVRPADIQEAIAFVQEMMEDAKSAY
ncbi:MAG: hypothetical protein ACOVQA_04645, partial [Thermoflexibacteraceae bacterium]